jgi:hypothetical protein
VDEGIARSLLSVAEAELEHVLDSTGGPVRRLRQKISRLNIRIRELSGDDACATEEQDDDNGDDEDDIDNISSNDDDDDVERRIRRRPKIGSYKKNARVAFADHAALHKYQQRKLVEFELAVENLFNTALGSGEGDSPGAVASRERGENAFRWVFNRVLIKRPKLWEHLLRAKGTI